MSAEAVAVAAERTLEPRLRLGSADRWPRFRIPTIVDDCTRVNIALIADTSHSGLRVAIELDRMIVARAKPQMIVRDNGTEFTSNAILRRADQSRVESHYIARG